MLYVVGRKGVAYYRFRDRPIEASWTGFSEQPTFADAREIGETLIEAFLAGADDEDDAGGHDGVLGVDEFHIVYTQFRSLVTQEPVANFLAPMEVVEAEVARARGRPAARTSSSRSGRGARRAAAEVRRHPDLRRAARGGGQRVGGPSAGDEGGHGQRGRADQEVHP